MKVFFWIIWIKYRVLSQFYEKLRPARSAACYNKSSRNLVVIFSCTALDRKLDIEQD